MNHPWPHLDWHFCSSVLKLDAMAAENEDGKKMLPNSDSKPRSHPRKPLCACTTYSLNKLFLFIYAFLFLVSMQLLNMLKAVAVCGPLVGAWMRRLTLRSTTLHSIPCLWANSDNALMNETTSEQVVVVIGFIATFVGKEYFFPRKPGEHSISNLTRCKICLWRRRGS